MQLDVRLTTLDRLDEVLASPATTISIGHEGCPHKLPSLADMERAADRIRAADKQFTFVAPITYERFIATMVASVQHLISTGPLGLVINDIGLLCALQEVGIDHAAVRLAAGHGLSYSFEQQPWLELTLEQEAPQIRELFVQNSLHDPVMWSQLQTWGVQTIEVDALPQAGASYAALQGAGFQLNMLLDVVPIAYARSCHTARHYKASPPGCESLCEQPFQLTTTHRWRLYHNHLEPMGRATQTAIPDFTVYGNIVYRHTPPVPPRLPQPATYTLDVRYYSPAALRERIAALEAHLDVAVA